MLRFPLILIAIGLVLSLNACNGSTPQETSAPPTPVVETVQPSPTPQPTASPTPNQPLAVLLAPPGADENRVKELQPVLTELAEQSGLRFQIRPELSAAEVGPETAVVVVLPPYPELDALAAQAPQTQFLGLGFPGLAAHDNLSVISGGKSGIDQVAFTAGYLAAVITDDWRVGVVAEQGTASGELIWEAFNNGVIFFCGLCRPAYPPFPTSGYPLPARLPQGASAADWQAVAANFGAWEVKTVFVDPALADPELMAELAAAGLRLIGTRQPAANLQSGWVASLQSADPSSKLVELWPALIAGEGGFQVDLPLEITHTNREYLSAGRQDLVEAMLVELQAGYIGTGADESSGS